jgi:hypothetical protein
MQATNNQKGDAKTLAQLQRKSVFGQQSRVEENRVILFDSKQPLLSGDHMQTTCSIFSNNELLATKK